MKIVVLVKHVPDATGDRGFLDDTTTDRQGIDSRLSELDEYAIEQALQIAESSAGVEVVYLTMGPSDAADSLRRALSMGGDGAVHVVDDRLHGTDAISTSLVLARALERCGFDLVLAGMASTDAAMSVVPAMLAERLGVPQLTLAAEIAVEGSTVRIRRDGDAASEWVEAALPAVASVTDQTSEARYPSFKGIMAAKKKPLETLTLDDLGVDPSEVGLAGAWSTVRELTQRPPRQAGTIINDEGNGGIKLAEFLAAGKFI